MKLFIVATTRNGQEAAFQFISAKTKAAAKVTYKARNNARAAKVLAAKDHTGEIIVYNNDLLISQLDQLNHEPWTASPTTIPAHCRLN